METFHIFTSISFRIDFFSFIILAFISRRLPVINKKRNPVQWIDGGEWKKCTCKRKWIKEIDNFNSFFMFNWFLQIFSIRRRKRVAYLYLTVLLTVRVTMTRTRTYFIASPSHLFFGFFIQMLCIWFLITFFLCCLSYASKKILLRTWEWKRMPNQTRRKHAQGGTMNK